MYTSNFEIKKRLVEEDKSNTFKSWKSLVPSITKEEFIKNLEWVCSDKRENKDGTGKLTREIGLTSKGIIHLNRENSWTTAIYCEDNKELWKGDFFKVKADKKAVKMGYADKDGMIESLFKISLSAEDKI